jgi:capsular exopolysaccharide synthesis family protein
VSGVYYQALNRAEREGVNVGVDMQSVEVSISPEAMPLAVAQQQIPLDQVENVAFAHRNDSHIVVHDPRHRAAAESFRLLRYRLEKMRERQPISSILIASSIPKEGKTLVAVNLASALALTSTRVLLIDADLRRPAVHSALGLPALPGLAESLQNKIDLGAAYRRVDPLGFYLLSAGRVPVNPVELLQGAGMRRLLNEATSSFDWVIVDSPPLLPFADGHCLAFLCNAVLMVARERMTKKEDLQEALSSLKAAQVIGTILNEAKSRREDEYYSGYGPTDGAKSATADGFKQTTARRLPEAQ